MITALDTNILLDLLIPDAPYVDGSQRALDEALVRGALVIGEVVYAELASQFLSAEDLDRFLAETHIRLDSSRPPALCRAAQAWQGYLARRGAAVRCPRCGKSQHLVCIGCGETIAVRQHILSDFLVGAHAALQADQLLTRDLGFYKSYFPELAIAAVG